MKVFISWSGPLAGNVAEKLRTWLRKVIQVVEPFVSSQDIDKGDVWLVELLRELQESSVGIICVTRENLHRDWLLFESGALIRQMGRGRLCTLLIDVSPAEVAPLLSVFQSTTFKREDVFRLVQTIHSALERPRPLLLDAELEEQFETHWPDLESHVRKALSEPAPQQSEIQELAQELLLPVIYREAANGDLDTVFHWLEIAKAKKVASLESQLAFVEASL
jgi:TIR domain